MPASPAPRRPEVLLSGAGAQDACALARRMLVFSTFSDLCDALCWQMNFITAVSFKVNHEAQGQTDASDQASQGRRMRRGGTPSQEPSVGTARAGHAWTTVLLLGRLPHCALGNGMQGTPGRPEEHRREEQESSKGLLCVGGGGGRRPWAALHDARRGEALGGTRSMEVGASGFGKGASSRHLGAAPTAPPHASGCSTAQPAAAPPATPPPP